MVDVPPPLMTLEDLFGEEEPDGPTEGGPGSEQPLPASPLEATLALDGVVEAPEPT
ncbi:hypothetical protein SAMN05421756_106205 [Microlunatus flavus]|uniref:Uncharacterized protein n=1 Tax=Microlunatus flavus TaxID=1036181 RepID=A0A1H9JHS4_9ACTN|nr:hypothetical protein SAMN05421756_106205 [Microlunatus flavus]